MSTRRITRSASRSAEPGVSDLLQLPMPTVRRTRVSGANTGTSTTNNAAANATGAATSASVVTNSSSGASSVNQDEDNIESKSARRSSTRKSIAVTTSSTSTTDSSRRTQRTVRTLDFHDDETVNEASSLSDLSDSDDGDDRIMSQLLPGQEAKMYKIDACDSHVTIDHLSYTPRRRGASLGMSLPSSSIVSPAKPVTKISPNREKEQIVQPKPQIAKPVVQPAKPPAFIARLFATINYAAKMLWFPLLLLLLVAAATMYSAPFFLSHLAESRTQGVPKEIDAAAYKRILAAASERVKTDITGKVLSAYAKVIELKEVDASLRALIEGKLTTEQRRIDALFAQSNGSMQDILAKAEKRVEEVKGEASKMYVPKTEAERLFLTQTKLEAYLSEVWSKSLLSPNNAFFQSLSGTIRTSVVDAATKAAIQAANDSASAHADAALKAAVAEATQEAKAVAAKVAKDEFIKESAKLVPASSTASVEEIERVARASELQMEALREQALKAAEAAAKSKVAAELAKSDERVQKELAAQAEKTAESARVIAAEKASLAANELRGEISELSSTLTARIAQAEKRLDEHHQQISSMEKRIKEIEDVGARVEQSVKQDIAILSGKVADATSALSSEVAKDLANESSKLVLQIKAANDAAANAQKDADAVRDRLHSELETIRTLLASMKDGHAITATADLAVFSERVSHFETKLQTVNERAERAESIVNTEMKAVQGKIKAQSEQLSDVLDRLNKLTGDVDELKEAVAGIRLAQDKYVEAQSSVESRFEGLERKLVEIASNAGQSTSAPVDMTNIIDYVDRRLEIYDADRTAKVDFALKSAGGVVVAHSSTFERKSEYNGWLEYIRSCYAPKKQPDTVIESNGRVGECWPMAGSSGYVLLRLTVPVQVTSITLHHVSKTIAMNVETAPRKFRVYGVTDIDAAAAARAGENPPSNAIPGTLLGSFEYDINGKFALQEFPVTAKSAAAKQAFSYLKFEVLSNHGHSDFTCLYRIRVHGAPAIEQH